MDENPYHPPTIPAEIGRSSTPTGRFVQRSVVNGEQVVVLRYLALYWWVRWPTMLLTLLVALYSPQQPMIWIAVGAWVLLVALGVPYWSIGAEIKERMKSQPVTMQGSKYSLTNPLTYRWALPG